MIDGIFFVGGAVYQKHDENGVYEQDLRQAGSP